MPLAPLLPDLLDRSERVNGLTGYPHGDVLLDGRELDVHVGNALRTASLERTIDGASTVTLVIRDPDARLLNSGLLARAVTVTLDGLSFRLADWEYDEEGDLTLTFEARAVAL